MNYCQDSQHMALTHPGRLKTTTTSKPRSVFGGVGRLCRSTAEVGGVYLFTSPTGALEWSFCLQHHVEAPLHQLSRRANHFMVDKAASTASPAVQKPYTVRAGIITHVVWSHIRL